MDSGSNLACTLPTAATAGRMSTCADSGCITFACVNSAAGSILGPDDNKDGIMARLWANGSLDTTYRMAEINNFDATNGFVQGLL